MSLHIRTVRGADLDSITKRQKAAADLAGKSITWQEARRRAVAWVRGMSGMPVWGEPGDREQPTKIASSARPPRRLKSHLRKPGWWESFRDMKKGRHEDRREDPGESEGQGRGDLGTPLQDPPPDPDPQ